MTHGAWMMKLLNVGGVAGGASPAAHARRLSEDTGIIRNSPCGWSTDGNE